MVGDPIEIKETYKITAKAIWELLPVDKGQKMTIGIAGESGSGKSVTAVALQQVLQQEGMSSVILHQDDYFVYPPLTNHQKRVENFEHIGLAEVRLDLLSSQIEAFKEGAKAIQKPLVYYRENKIEHEEMNFQGVQVLIVEGTYVASLEGLDARIFMCRDYHQTIENRKNRGRDVVDEFSERVLQREHEIISSYKLQSEVWVLPDYSVRLHK